MCTKLLIQYAPTKSINTRRGGGGDMNIISKDVWVKKGSRAVDVGSVRVNLKLSYMSTKFLARCRR